MAVVGGLALNVANAWGVTLLRPADPSDLPRAAIVRIEAEPNVCWKAEIGLGNGHESACGDATLRLEAHSGDARFYPPDMAFYASVQKTYEKKVRGRVSIILVVEGEEADRGTTLYDSASVSY